MTAARRPQPDYNIYKPDVRRYGCLCGCRKPTNPRALFFNSTCRKRHQRRRERWEALPELTDDQIDEINQEPELFDPKFYE